MRSRTFAKPEWVKMSASLRIRALLFCVLALSACGRNLQGPSEDIAEANLSEMVWPQLERVEPSPAVIGEKLVIVGRGGYVKIETEAESGYNESYRTFPLYLDSQELGELGCFVNRCEGEIIIPSDLGPGEYELSVQGGSGITISVAEN